MRYKIKDIPDEGLRAICPFPAQLLADATAGVEAQQSTSLASAEVELSRASDDVVVRGQLRARLVLACARCLRPTPLPLDATP